MEILSFPLYLVYLLSCQGDLQKRHPKIRTKDVKEILLKFLELKPQGCLS